jgi:hypothetical protein
MDYYYYLDNGSYIPILELNMILTLPYHYTLITISINDRFIIFLSKMIAIPIILTNNASDVLQQWTLRLARGTCSKLIVTFPTGGVEDF